MIYLDSSVALAYLLARIAIQLTRCGISRPFPAGCSNAKFGIASIRVGLLTRTAKSCAA
jgi:hypothetical protein